MTTTRTIAALDTPTAEVEAAARSIAARQLLGEQAHDLDDCSDWCAQHPLAQTPATDKDYPGWDHHIAQMKALNELHRRVAQFNRLHPVGTPVTAYPGARPERIPTARQIATTTRTRAAVYGGHVAAVHVDGYSSYIALTHIDIRTEETS